MTEPTKDKITPWTPMADPVDIKVVGKLLEELAEYGEVNCRLIKAVSRCLIQGLEGTEPDTGEKNKDWLQKEMADALAGLELIIERFDLDENFIIERKDRKKHNLRKWHRMDPIE